MRDNFYLVGFVILALFGLYVWISYNDDLTEVISVLAMIFSWLSFVIWLLSDKEKEKNEIK